jgi:hypothetical protein
MTDAEREISHRQGVRCRKSLEDFEFRPKLPRRSSRLLNLARPLLKAKLCQGKQPSQTVSGFTLLIPRLPDECVKPNRFL